ncbi:MAG: TonB-dependent receptor [Polymorphobacter sp.]
MLLLAGVATPGMAVGQTIDERPSDNGEIVVTARKRAERLQDVPISIQALSGTEMERLGLKDLESVARFSPSLVFDRGANPEASTIAIRGLSPTRGRPNAAILVDGIDVTSEAIGSAGGGILLSQRLLDLERVEVVRGPQSVQYGRSAFAGAIQYVTANPSDDLTATVSAEAGSHNRFAVRGSISGPVIEGLLGVRVAGAAWSEGGFYRDQALSARLGGGHGTGFAITALLTPASNLSFKGRLDYFDDSFRPAAQYLVRSNTGLINSANNTALATAVAGGVTSSSAFAGYRGTIPDANQLGNPRYSPDPLTGRSFEGSHREVMRATLVSTFDAGPATVTAWTGYTDGNFSNRQDFDQDAILVGPPGQQTDSASRSFIADSNTLLKQFSQELRISTATNKPIRLTLGGLYWSEDSSRLSRTLTVACAATIPECAGGAAGRIPFINLVDDPASRRLRHGSVYGGLEWQAMPTVKFTVEGRYSWENERVIGSNCGLPTNRFGVRCGDPFATSAQVPPVFGPSSLLGDGRTLAAAFAVPVTMRTKNNFFTPRFIAEWKAGPDALLYASASKGVKPGGTSTLAAGAWFDSDLDGDTDEVHFGAETLWSYELGTKLGLFDNRLRLNLAGFLQRYADKQVVSQRSTPSGSPVAVIENAGKARVWGLEVDASVKITEGLNLGLAYTFLDTRYTKFQIFTDTKSNIIDAGECVVVTIGKPVCQVDLSGNQLEKSPRHSLVGTVSYVQPLTKSIRLFTEGNFNYRSKRFVDQWNNRVLKGYSQTDIRLGLRTDRFEILGYINNLFDDDTVRSADTKTGDVDRIGLGLSSASQVVLATLPEPRTYGLRLNMRF